MACPDEAKISEFVARALTATVAARIEAHLADCDDCRNLVFALASSGDDTVLLKITLGRGRGSDVDGLIRHRDMHRVAISVGIDGDRADDQPSQSANDSARNRATIRDQHFVEHDNAFDPAGFPTPRDQVAQPRVTQCRVVPALS